MPSSEPDPSLDPSLIDAVERHLEKLSTEARRVISALLRSGLRDGAAIHGEIEGQFGAIEAGETYNEVRWSKLVISEVRGVCRFYGINPEFRPYLGVRSGRKPVGTP